MLGYPEDNWTTKRGNSTRNGKRAHEHFSHLHSESDLPKFTTVMSIVSSSMVLRCGQSHINHR